MAELADTELTFDGTTDDVMVWVCEPEWCDAKFGVHTDAPKPFLAWKIKTKDEPECYGSGDGEFYCVPADEAEVKPVMAYRWACGAWSVGTPEQMSWNQYRSEHDMREEDYE